MFVVIKRRLIGVCLIALALSIIVSVLVFSKNTPTIVNTDSKIVVIDAGHGESSNTIEK